MLLARLDSDGDVLLAGPAIRAAAAGAERVTLLCGPRGLQAAELLPGVEEIVVHRAGWIDPNPGPFRARPVRRLLLELESRRFEQAAILTSFHQSPLPLALLLRLAGVQRIGAISPDYAGSLLDVRHHVQDGLHEVQRGLSLMQAMGCELPAEDDGALRICAPEFDDEEEMLAARPFAQHVPYIVVHPGASVPARAWAPRRHAELVGELVAAGRHVAVTGSMGERELTAFVAAAGRDSCADAQVRDLGGRTTLRELAAIVAGAEAIVVGNTGPAHLAAAVGTPVVSLFAQTVPPARWRPWRVPHELLTLEVPCAGCRARVCPVRGHPCIDSVTPQEALSAIARLTRAEREAALA